MRKKKRIAHLIIIPFAFVILYIIFAAKPLTREYNLKADWTINTFDDQVSAVKGEDLVPFKFKNQLGYFSQDGKIYSKYDFDYKACITENYWTSYSEDSASFYVYGPDGKKVSCINEEGFPFLSQNRIYVLLPGGTSLAQFDLKGNELFLQESYSPLTAISSSRGGTAAGYADGSIKVFDSNGVLKMNFIPGGSSVNIIYGLTLSDDGKYCAYITGLDRQRVEIALEEDGKPKILYTEYFDSDLTRQTFMKFNGNVLYYDYTDGLGIVNLKNCKSYKYEIPGLVKQLEFSGDSKVAFLLTKDKSEYTLTFLEPYNHFAGKLAFNAESAFVQVRGNNVFLGRDGKISKLTLSRK